MNKAKPLGQICPTGAGTPSASTKALNKVETDSMILDKQKGFVACPGLDWVPAMLFRCG